MPDSVPSVATKGQVSSPHARAESCWISFGGNVGDVKATFDAALALLSLHSQIQLGTRSGLYRSCPMGSQAGSPYLNAVCELKTTLSPPQLLTVLQSVENHLGRAHDIRWGPRTLDLDIVSYGGLVHESPHLVLPHPGITYRRFMVDPLAEVEPNWTHPICHVTVSDLVGRMKQRPLHVSIIKVSPEQLELLSPKLRLKFPQIDVVRDGADCKNRLRIQTGGAIHMGCGSTVDLRRAPGDLLEQLTSAFTAMLDEPERIGDW